MLISDFDFDLPEELIASYPLEKRDQSRLLHYNLESKSLHHKKFQDISEILKAGDILVRNTSRVLAARLYLYNPEKYTNKPLEALLINPLNTEETKWSILAKPAKKIKEEATEYVLKSGEAVKVYRIKDQDEFILEFKNESQFKKAIEECGQMPIPPYFKREAEALDKERYQTVYANQNSTGRSVAAPTAGLHFTDTVIDNLKNNGVEFIDVNLDVGIGTFKPVSAEKVADHKMHAENYEIASNDWDRDLNSKKRRKKNYLYRYH